MSEFDQLVSEMDSSLMEVFGDACTYNDLTNPVIETRVAIEKNVEIMSAYDTQMPARRNVASLIKSDIPDPKRGHTITVGSETHIVDRLNTDDGHIVTVLLQ